MQPVACQSPGHLLLQGLLLAQQLPGPVQPTPGVGAAGGRGDTVSSLASAGRLG